MPPLSLPTIRHLAFRTLRTCADLVWCGGCSLDQSRCEADDNERFRVAGVTNRQLSLMIAVVEDNEGLRVALGRLLRAAGYRTALYESAEAYLAAAPAAPVCLLLDMNLPGMSGLDLQRHLRTRPSPPAIILMSADRSLADDAESLGCDAFFAKPVPTCELLIAVARFVNREAELSARDVIE